MRSMKALSAMAGALLLTIALIAPAAGTPLAPNPGLDQTGQGLSVAEGGVGLEDLGDGTRNITVTFNGEVQSAFLYWTGRQFGCADASCLSGRDQTLVFDGTAVTGTMTGTENGTTEGTNVGYRADVTSIVAAKGGGAAKSFTIADGDALDLDRLNGAGLLVIYEDPSDNTTYRVIVYEGLDFAWNDATTDELRTTDPVTFDHGATADARAGDLIIFAGDGEAARPDRIDISNNPSRVNELNASDGPQWDTENYSIDIPGGVGSTTVQLFSEPPNANADSLLWQLGVLRFPVPSGTSTGCTPGYWKNHHDAWPPTGYSPSQTVNSVFSAASAFPSLGSATLDQALSFGGGRGTQGSAKILLRAGVAALLNAGHPDVNYPQSDSQVIDSVNAALASNDRGTMIALAGELDDQNNGRCTLN